MRAIGLDAYCFLPPERKPFQDKKSAPQHSRAQQRTLVHVSWASEISAYALGQADPGWIHLVSSFIYENELTMLHRLPLGCSKAVFGSPSSSLLRAAVTLSQKHPWDGHHLVT